MLEGLPDDVVLKILTRISVDNLLRCTTVSKSWYSLLTSSSFVSSHLKLLLANNQKPLLIWFYNRDVHIINQNLQQLAQLDCPLASTSATESSRYFKIIDSLNGVVCLFDCPQYGGRDRERIMLWNPFIRKSFMLPTYRPNSTYCKEAIGFGFLPGTNDFKLVIILYTLHQQVELAVYELSTGSWREINDPDFRYHIQRNDSQVFLGGIVHWCGLSRHSIDHPYSPSVVFFDMITEKFSEFMLPSRLQNENGNRQMSTFRGSLCVMQNAKDSCMIWVMKEYGVADSWIMPFKIDVSEYRSSTSCYLRENGEILTNRRYNGPLVSFDPVKKKGTDIRGWKKKNLEGVYNYTKSLFLMKSFKQHLSGINEKPLVAQHLKHIEDVGF